MPVNSRFSYNALIVVRYLPDGELDTGLHLFEHLSSYFRLEGLRLDLVKVSSRIEFFEFARKLILEAHSGLMPILHFEMHGHEDRGLSVGKSEFVGWHELANCLRPVNILAKGNLFVGMAACHGIRAFQPQDIDKPSPFYALVGPSKEVSVGVLESEFQRLYGSLFAHPIEFSEIAKNLPDPLMLFHAEQFFTQTMVQYYESACTGKRGAGWMESLTTKIMRGQGSADRGLLRTVRKQAKSAIRPNKEQFDALARRFIVQHSLYAVTFEEVMQMVENRRGRI